LSSWTSPASASARPESAPGRPGDKRLLPEYRLPDIDVLALYPSRRHLSAKIRAMIDFLMDAFGGLPPWDRDDGG
jgi:DNA-binding transcriptional LysR family regulator